MPRSRLFIALAMLATGVGAGQAASAADIAARPWVFHHIHHTYHGEGLARPGHAPRPSRVTVHR